ncbi:hypothetical protein D1872_36710 [compost metagenome]
MKPSSDEIMTYIQNMRHTIDQLDLMSGYFNYNEEERKMKKEAMDILDTKLYKSENALRLDEIKHHIRIKKIPVNRRN